MKKGLSGGDGGNSKRRRRSRSSSGCDGFRSDGSRSTTTTNTGCINAFFQLFHLNHYFNFPFNSSSSSTNSNFSHSQPPTHHLLQGVVAPRNSLEMEEVTFKEASSTAVLSSSSTINQNQKSLQLPMSGMQIKTIATKTADDSQDNLSSPATKTPTLVARLMGLDLLPETSSPRPSSSSSSTLSSSKYLHSHHQLLQNRQNSNSKSMVSSRSKNDITTGTRSLPDTPRTSSSSSARRSDVDQRFSLQMNKENCQLPCNEFEFSKFLTAKIAAATARRKEDENMSPGHYAKQIVKQFKESVSRRVGRDITNSTSTVFENRTEHRRDQHVVLLKSKKPTVEIYQDNHSQIITTPQNQNSSSPRLRFLEIKNKSSNSDHSPKLSTSQLSDKQIKKVSSTSKATQAVKVSEEEQDQQIPSKNGKKIEIRENHGARIKKRPQTSDLIRSKQEESFVKSASTSSRIKSSQFADKKCKKSTPLSNVPTTLTVKKDPSPPATRFAQEEQKHHQSSLSHLTNSLKNGKQLSSCLNQFIQKPLVPDLTEDCNISNSTTTATGELSEYISRILKCAGIEEYTRVSITSWYSPSHPLNPSIFHHLKLSQSSIGQCKLIFDVADEILAEILKPYLNSKPWRAKQQRNSWQLLYGRQLMDTLCRKIRSFPAANCRVLDDIDRIIDKDLGENWGNSSFGEEISDVIVSEIEGAIWSGLMHEMVMDMWFLVSVG